MISIVIPALNEKRYIGALLGDILAQNFSEEIEIVVADADSTDGTLEVIKGFEARHKNLKVVKGGLPAIARNNGGKASAGDPIFFVDADMKIADKDFLKKAVSYFREKKLGIATVFLKPDSDYWVDHALVLINNIWLPISKYFRPSGAMCIVVTREIFQKTGGYAEDEIMCEDHNFVYNSSKLGKYDVLPVTMLFSVRRFNKEGRFTIVWKYALTSIYLVLFGSIKKPPFEYGFGDYKEEHDKRRLL